MRPSIASTTLAVVISACTENYAVIIWTVPIALSAFVAAVADSALALRTSFATCPMPNIALTAICSASWALLATTNKPSDDLDLRGAGDAERARV